ncbi:MAG: hypothetical protein AB8H47_30995, partial [Bacteroidia bacterium]
WEAALPWVQADPDRISRLLSQKILLAEGDNLRLSPIVQQFWEQWEGENANLYSWAEFQADWQEFEAQILAAEHLPATAKLRYWVAQLQLWQQFLISLTADTIQAEQITWLQKLEGKIKRYTSLKLGLVQALDRQLILLLDALQEFSQSSLKNEINSELSNQITRLQSLRRKDLLFEQTDIENQMLTLDATLWNAKPSNWLWPSLRAES